MFHKRLIGFYIILVLFLSIYTVSGQEEDFTAWFLSYPDRMDHFDQTAERTRELLERFKPRLFISPDSYPPVDFYLDYLPDTVLRKGSMRREILETEVDRDVLLRVHQDGDYYLDYQLSARDVMALERDSLHPTFYGRVYRDWVMVDGEKISLLFLKYSPVYPVSGLPPGIPRWKRFFSRFIGNPDDWHELDIHGAIHVVLLEETEYPIGVLLAQHNHHRTYLRGIDFEWPEDDSVLIAPAVKSNEPYVIRPGELERWERTVGNPTRYEYLFGRTDRAPIEGGFDLVPTPASGAFEVDMKIDLLPLDDPLFTSRANLGERRKALGLWETFYIAGPPGMDYYTFPQLKNLGDLFAFWYIDPGYDEFFRLTKENLVDFSNLDVEPVLHHQLRRFSEILSKIID
jgi:hypothetical protein